MPIGINGTGSITGITAGGLPDGVVIADDIASGAVTQTKLASGVAGNGPAFYAYPSTNQNVVNNTFTKVTLDSELFDTANNFNTSTNRFTPNVAGYYQINCRLSFLNTANMTDCFASLYKNGSEYARLGGAATGGTASVSSPSGSTIVYMNGSTDYLELYAYQSNAASSTVQTNAFGSPSTHLTGVLVRSA